ncbi:hypothetical protein M433DRAFT_60317 [Acidomyces richmondensis BFW]|nr:MAG: hypothetical protein FE78DRAFT_141132 [Acidomyces sp. 'richmondensis']KYG48857.1 hypothetical protein M433DRAFT_60317 [Acidomyces richmondensis BFW]
MNHSTLRLTPSNSPFFRSTPPRSPTKTTRTEEPGLRLSKVIGTTTSSANAFDCLPSARKFAYTAGAAAVVAVIRDDLTIDQTFFRARPALTGTAGDPSGLWPSTPVPNDARNRTVGVVKEQKLCGSPLAPSARDWSDSPTGKSITAKDRIKAAKSVALSPNGKWLAVGETGYKPRILVFALADGSNETPVTVLAEHTFGVHALSFSPDSKHLASLGTVNDGFLHVWSIDDRTGAASLHASNKCTSTINRMAWMGGCIITAGLRFVKVWRPDEDAPAETRRIDAAMSPHTPRNRGDNRPPEFGSSILSPRHKVLHGKNCLLGDMLERNFVAVVPITDQEAVICSESGCVCLLQDSGKLQVLTAAAQVDFEISAASLDDAEQLVLAGPGGKTISPTKQHSRGDTQVVGMAAMSNAWIEVDSRGEITIKRCATDDVDASTYRLPAHDGGNLGVQPINSRAVETAAILTFSGAGDIRFWDRAGAPVSSLNCPVEYFPEMFDVTNELKSVVPFGDGAMLACGDKYGNLTVLDLATRGTLQTIRAHANEITDIRTLGRPGTDLLATASRDRTVQLFAWSNNQLELLQTLDEHAGAVTELLTLHNGELLLSCSADRSVVVREAVMRVEGNPYSVVFGMTRAVAMKSAPTSMCLAAEDDSIWVSSLDRSISRFNIKTGQTNLTFKCSDAEGGEAVVMSRILFARSLNGNPTLVGISSTDKSVRLYTDYGTLVARDWGHTEGITGLSLIPGTTINSGSESSDKLVTVAADSTIFFWDTTPSPSATVRQLENGSETLDVVAASRPKLMAPLRKVISYSELSRFRGESTANDEGDPPSPTSDHKIPQQSPPHRLRRKTSRMSVAQPPRLEPAFRTNFDPLAASTESVCRTLRAYRKKLENPAIVEMVTLETLRELEAELRSTIQLLDERMQGRVIDEEPMHKGLGEREEIESRKRSTSTSMAKLEPSKEESTTTNVATGALEKLNLGRS